MKRKYNKMIQLKVICYHLQKSTVLLYISMYENIKKTESILSPSSIDLL